MATTLLEAAKRLGIKTEAQDKTAPTALTTLTPEQLEEGKKGYEKFIEDQKNNMPWYDKVANAIEDVSSSISIWAHTQLFGSVLNPWARKGEKTKELPYAMSPEKPSADWSNEERNTFGYLYTQDANEAAKYAIKVYNKYNAEEQKILDKVSETTAKETPVLSSIASVALAPTSIVGMLNTARDYAISKKYGETVKSADYVSALNQQSTRGAIANQLNTSGTLSDDLWTIGGKGWGDVYSLGMSIADSLFLGAGTATGAGMLLNRATYFSRSATEGYNDAISRGLSPDAAGLYGVITGAIECLTESASDKLLANVGKDQAKGLLGETLRQMGQEGVEEFVSALVDALAQEGLFGENSDRQRLIKYYMSEFNMSHEEASKRALSDLAGEIVFAGLGGALSGGVSAGAVGGLKTAWNKSSVNPLNQTATKELGPIQDKLFESGKTIEDGTSRATIDKLSQKKESGKELSGYDLRKLHSAVTEGQETDTKNNVKLAIAERLKDKGVKIEDIPALTKIILSKALGENLTKVQQIKLKNNEIATAVSNEMDATNMLSGNFDSQWAIDAGINKIRDVSGAIQTALAEANKQDVAEGSTTALNLSTEAREALRGKFTGLNSAYTPQSENTRIHTNEIKSTTLDAKQTAQIRAIERVANALGVDFYIYESEYSKKDGRKYVDKDGNVITDSGYYDPRDNSIHIDLHAGQNGEGTMLYTASHELVHWIKKSAADQFEALKDFVLGSLEKEGVQIDTLIEKQINKAKENGRDMDRDGAIEEIVADACMTVLTTDAGIKAVTNLKTENKGLWNALKRFFTQFFNRIDKMYKGVKVDSEEGQYLADMHETAKKLRDLFVEGAQTAAKSSETKQTKAEQEEAFEKSYLRTKNIKSNARLTATHRAKLAAMSDSASAVTKDKLLERYDAIAKVWNEIGGELNSNFLEAWNNKEGKDRVFTIFKAQSGYKYNVELSSMCKKGIPLFEAIDTIVREEILNQLETKTLGKAEKEILYDLLKERGFDIPCAICYVEQARQREGAIIDAFLDGKIEKSKTGKVTQFKIGWNETYDALEKGMKSLGVDYKFPTVDRSIATDNYKASDAVEMDAKTQDAFYSTLLALINKEIRRYNSVKDAKAKARMPLKSITPSEVKRCLSGTLGSNLKLYKTIATNPASRFRIQSDLLYSSMTTTNLATAHPQLYSLFNSQGGVSTFKTKQATAIYWADILNKKWDASKLRKEGGVRNQSNSDFMMYTLLDHAQMYIDFTAKGYYLQAYTKVLAELKLFGLSRGKINASFIPKVTVYYNEDGTVDYDKTRENAGLDKNGNPIYDDIEGVNHAEAFMLLEDAEYSKSIGGICIGYSDKHIAKLLDDKRIQQIIGFHDKTDDPTKRYRGARYAKNYNGENEAQKQHSDGTLETIHIGFNQYVIAAEKLFKKDKATETFSGTAEYKGKQYNADDIPMLAADMYLEMCREKNYIPAYQQFASHPNYYKLLADFSLKDANGHYAPHQKVAYNMPDVVPYLDENGKKQYMPTRDYIKQELKKELTVRDDIAAALSDHSEEGLIPQFVKKVNDLHSERKSSFRGVKSKADNTLLAAAKMMESEGRTSEEIRQATGWFRGLDKKWRLEIDDSKLKIKEQPGAMREYLKLSDVMEHDELFAAYPELKDAWFGIDPYISEGGRASLNGIVLKEYPTNSQSSKGILMHEIQHLIQNIEGFAVGANKEMYEYDEWNDKLDNALARRNNAADRLIAILRRRGNSIPQSDINSERYFNMRDRDAVIDRYYFELSTLAEQNKRTGEIWDAYWDAVQELYRSTPEGKYHATAGEIEAYNVMNRVSFTAEERKNTRPDIDRTDAIIRGVSEVSYFAKETYDPETANIRDQLKNAQKELNQMEIAFSGNAPLKFASKSAAKAWAVEELKKYGFAVDRQGIGTIQFAKNDIYGAIEHLTSAEEISAIIAVPRVLKRGIKIGEHGNHKMRDKHTITIAAPVQINGVRGNMAVVVNLRNNKYYIHRLLLPDGVAFAFGENKNANQEMYQGVPIGSLANTTRFASNQRITHLNANVNTPTENSEIKSSSRKKRTVTLSVGEEAKFRANYTRSKVFSKSNMYRIIEKFASKGELSGKTIEELADDMWISFNSATSVEERREFAHSTAQFVVSKLLQESKSQSKEAVAATEQLLYLKGGIRRIDFTPDEITEIRFKKDESGLKSIRARWGYHKSHTNAKVRPYPLDVFVTDVAREVPGMAYLADMNHVDAFFEIADMYDTLKAKVKDRWVSNYAETSNSDLDALQMEIEQTIFDAYITEGEQSKFGKFVSAKLDAYKERTEYWKAAYDNFKDRARLENLVTYKAQKMEDLKKGTFLNATQYGNADAFKDSIEKLSSLKFRGAIRKPNAVRDIFKPILAWYTKDNPMLIDPKADEASPHKYSYEVAAMLEVIANGENGLSNDELAAIYEIMNYFTKFIETYNKVWRNGKWEDAIGIATTDIEIMQHVAKSNTMSALKRAANKYAELFSEPMFVARMSDGYQNGFFTQTMTELREAAKNAAIAEMEVREDYDKFLKEHPEYVEKASTEMVEFKGVQIPKMQLISLYMTYHRKHAQAGLIFNGFKFTTQPTKVGEVSRTIAIPGATSPNADLSQAEFNALVKMEITLIRSKLNATDKEYIKMLEGLYNGQLRALKIQRDMDRLGFTNATLDYYYPIRRATIAKSIDTTVFEDVNRATNSSFNKNTVKGARQQLFIESADTLINKHIHEICNYAYMSGAIENYNVIYNLDVSGNPNNPVSVRTTIEATNLWTSSQKYFHKLVKDMQGIKSGDDTVINSALGWLRSGYVKFQLGLNLKTIASQASSIYAATSVLDYGSIVKGMGVDATGVDDYCAYAKLRHYDKSAIKAMTVTEKIDKKTEWVTAGIEAMDRLIVTKLFGACQVQAEKNGAGKIGTEENKIAAGKLLEKVILDTQSNALATEKSSAMRSESEVAKMLTMFRSDSMKVVTRVFESVGELRMLKANNASETEIKGAQVKVAKSVASLVMVSAFMATLAQLFRWIYNKEQDEDRVLVDVAFDFAGNLLSGVPLLSDLWDYFIDGFEPSSMALDVVFTLAGGVNSITKDLFDAIFSEDKPSSQKIMRDLRTVLYGACQFAGFPARNIYNMVTGVIGNISSEAEYRIDDFFNENNYYSDLKEAIEKEDLAKVDFLFSLAYGKQFGNSVSDATVEELNRLAKLGKDYRVLPKTIPDKITRDGIEYELTDNQKQDILTQYEKVNAAIDKLITLSSYKSLSDEKKVERLKYYYDKYFDLAVTSALGLAKSNEQFMYSAVGFDTYAKFHFATKGIKSDKDKNGNTISGSKRKKTIQAIDKLKLPEEKRLILIASKGYALTENERSKLVRYINGLKLSATTKNALAELCGFEVKNGKIVNK